MRHLLIFSSFFIMTTLLSFGDESATWNMLGKLPGEPVQFGFFHPYEIGEWDVGFGNHRAVLEVQTPSKAVHARIIWRRRDIWPEQKNVMIYDPVKKQVVNNRVVLRINREYADLVFEPTSGAGSYEVYYLQWDGELGETFKLGSQLTKPFPITQYIEPQETASPAWLATHQLTTPAAAEKQLTTLPKAQVKAIQALAVTGPESQRAFNSYFPMEIIATATETEALIQKHAADKAFLLFPENRKNPIKMPEDLPLSWVTRGEQNALLDTADKNEYYVFQIGVYALNELKNLSVNFTDLAGEKERIPADAFTCFNMNGIDWTGNAFHKEVNVPKERIQPLWCGVQIPRNAAAGNYQSTVSVNAAGLPAQTVTLKLSISNEILEDHGDHDLWRLSRLRWLNSTLGINDDVVKPYTPIQQEGNNLSILGRELKLNDTGLPQSAVSKIDMFSIQPGGREILSRAMQLIVKVDHKPLQLTADKLTFTHQSDGLVKFKTTLHAEALAISCEGSLEADGYLRYRYTLTPTTALSIDDVVLELPVQKDVAKYTMGVVTKRSGLRPKSFAKLPLKSNTMYNAFWTGDYNAGIACQLKNQEDEWNADNQTKHKLPELKQWYNQGLSFYSLQDEEDAAVFSVHTGAKDLEKGEDFQLNFALYITPFKPLQHRRWNYKIYHHAIGKNPQLEKGEQAQAGIYNIHHANIYNPYINYPFISAQKLKDFTDQVHATGKKVKIYYTVRELSVRASELWAMRSLGSEIYIVDEGWKGLSQKPLAAQKAHKIRTGHAWMAEHLVTDYRTRWHSVIWEGENTEKAKLLGYERDSSIATQGLSRWHNYYLEGLSWLRKNTGVDGLYLDGIGYDRNIMKRVRKAMQIEGLPESMIDFHGAVNYSWIQHAPYVDSIWYGEGARYQADPAYWLVEISGIPFGLTGEILGHKPDSSQFRGMVYGMCRRYGWHGGDADDALSLWKLWDEFGIIDSSMHGYWQANAPVTTSNPKVCATTYSKDGDVLIALGSWADEQDEVILSIDWKQLGLDPKHVEIIAPEVHKMQSQKRFNVGEPITILPKQGILLRIKST